MNGNKSLAELRAEKNMSQRDLAKELGVSSATIGMYEFGKRTPPLKKAILIAKLFDIQVENISVAATSPCLRKKFSLFCPPVITTHWKENLANFFRKKFKKFSTRHKKARLFFFISRVC
ncbi:MAG TPA: hypothetical protein DDY31_18225 [Lachnospiraceae bacterium]|nr:hypothetical protein [Lachnospiraceae bacterium]